MAEPRDLLFDWLKNADSLEAAVDGSSEAVDFDYTVPASRTCDLQRVLFTWVDNAVEDVDGFFTIAALTNGLLFQVVDADGSTVLQEFGTDDGPIQRHVDFNSLAGVDVTGTSDTPAASRFGVRWTIAKAGEPLTLTAGRKFRMKVQDDLSGAVQVRCAIQGLWRDYT